MLKASFSPSLVLCVLGACAGQSPQWTSDAARSEVRAVVDEQTFVLSNDQLVLATPTLDSLDTIALRTSSVAIGGRAIDTAVLATHVGGEELDLVRDGLVESFHVHPAGVEQSWRFPHAPPTSSDLVVALDVEGATEVDYVAGGLRLRGLGFDVFYSDGTWIDAGGTTTAVPAVFASGQIVLTVPAAAVAAARFPAVLDPQIIITPAVR